MTPTEAIAKLDNQLGLHGQTVTLRRLVPGNDSIDAIVHGFVRHFKPNELVDGLQQGDVSVILSPTSLGGFPLPVKSGDKLLIAGELKNIQNPEHVRMLDQIVRINLVVRG